MANVLLHGFDTMSEDMLNQRAATVPDVALAIDMSLEAHNAAVNDLIDLFCDRTTDYQGRFGLNAGGILQPLDEFGRSTPTKYSEYTVAWPIYMAGGATGMTWLVEPKITVRRLQGKLAQLFMQDLRWVRRRLMHALFDNTASGVTFNDDEWGALTLRGLANGDASPLYYKQYSDTTATDTHYFAQANAIGASDNPYTGLRDEILEHPENDGNIVALIPNDLKATTQALADFYDVVDPNLRTGDDVTTAAGFPSQIPADARPLGYLGTSQVFVAEWAPLPATYILAYATDGEKVLKWREDDTNDFRGFFAKDRKDQFPYVGEQWVRRAGTAANNRVGATITRIGNASYAIPTGFGLLLNP